MDKREFIKQVYQTVWGPNAKPKQFIIDGIHRETYTYEETIEKIGDFKNGFLINENDIECNYHC